jgi:hypothetical protein
VDWVGLNYNRDSAGFFRKTAVLIIVRLCVRVIYEQNVIVVESSNLSCYLQVCPVLFCAALSY